MVDIVSIVVSVAIGLIMIAVSFYLYTIYCHRNSHRYHSIGQGNRYCHWLQNSGRVLPIPILGAAAIDTTRHIQ